MGHVSPSKAHSPALPPHKQAPPLRGLGDLRSLADAILRQQAAVRRFPRPSAFPIPDAPVAPPSEWSPSLPNWACRTHWRRPRFPKDRCRRWNRHQARSHILADQAGDAFIGVGRRVDSLDQLRLGCPRRHFECPHHRVHGKISRTSNFKTTITGSVSKAELPR
jgi:hypothetical protein